MLNNQKGQLSITVIIFAAISVVLISGFVFISSSFLQLSVRARNKAQAFTIAESGIEYYRWHLAHAPQDYQDGTGGPGPYTHTYYDKSGEKIGEFILDITAPPSGSTVVKIKSTGKISADSSIEKIIEVRMAIPSFAKYAVAANDVMRFGAGTEVFGEIHSNGGIRFDGLTHNIISSAQTTYDDPDHSGADEHAVHTHLSPTDPLPPTPIPSRPDVFEAGRIVGVPALDFDGLTTDLASIKADAQSNGLYFGDSGDFGYNIILKTNDTFDLYSVDSLVTVQWYCYDPGQDEWGTWSINNQTLINNYPFPSNGLIFVEDDLWVEGQIDGARLTIASGRFPENPSTNTSITFNKDILYTNYDGSDVLSFIAQKNINAGMESENDMRIDAAIIAKNGRAGRYYYAPPWWIYSGCSPYHDRDTITLFGMIVTNTRYGFAYTDGTGYDTRNLVYDANLLYGPPPSFPLTSDNYETISWDELK